MFILVGELEFNEKQYYPMGGPCYLFVSTQLAVGVSDVEYVYAISQMPQPRTVHTGEVYRTKKNLSVTEFLQQLITIDVFFGSNVILSMRKAKVRLKGMTEWIEQPDIDSVIDEKVNR